MSLHVSLVPPLDRAWAIFRAVFMSHLSEHEVTLVDPCIIFR